MDLQVGDVIKIRGCDLKFKITYLWYSKYFNIYRVRCNPIDDSGCRVNFILYEGFYDKIHTDEVGIRYDIDKHRF